MFNYHVLRLDKFDAGSNNVNMFKAQRIDRAFLLLLYLH